jgi:oligosaccharyl transferase (archaeosortase A-associated)
MLRRADKKEEVKKAFRQLLNSNDRELIDSNKNRKEKQAPINKTIYETDLGCLNANRYLYIGLTFIFILSFYLRAVMPMNKVFVGDGIIYNGDGDPWYQMMLAKGTVINLQRIWFDPMTYFPRGTDIHVGSFVSWVITIFSYIVSLGYPSMHTVEIVGAFLPAILGSIIIFPLYVIGKELNGKACGIMSALMISILPGQFFARTALGYPDSHSAEAFLSTLTMMFFLIALKTGKDMTFSPIHEGSALKKPVIYSLFTGISLGAYICSWSSGILFEGIILTIIVIQSIRNSISDRNVEYLGIIGAITFLIAALVEFPFAPPSSGINTLPYYSLFQPIILILGAAGSLLISLLLKFLRDRDVKRHYFLAAIAGFLVSGGLAVTLFMHQFTRAFLSGINFLIPSKERIVAETRPLMYSDGYFTTAYIQKYFPGLANLDLLSTFFLALAGLSLLVTHYIKKNRATDLAVITWSLIILLLILDQIRYGYYYAVNVALLTGYLSVWLLRKSKSSDIDNRDFDNKSARDFLRINSKLVLVVVSILALLIWPSLDGSVVLAKSIKGPDSGWLSSLNWLQNNTPSPGMELYKLYERPLNGRPYLYPRTAYGIMSGWQYGHLIEAIGQRMPIANPMQLGIGNRTIPGSSPFFISENETQAERVLTQLDPNRSPYTNAKYVMIDWDMAINIDYIALLSSIPSSRYHWIINFSQDGQRPETSRLDRATFFRTMISRLYFFDGSETHPKSAFGMAYRPTNNADAGPMKIQIESLKFSKNYTDLLEYINKSKNKGYQAEILGKLDPRSPDSSVHLEALKHYRLVHESEPNLTNCVQENVKIFEHVRGAIIKGKAPIGTRVTISVPIATNCNRHFIYMQSNISNSNGEFMLILPYSTEGATANSTNFDAKPSGPYELLMGNKSYQLRVPENSVINGGIIEVNS